MCGISVQSESASHFFNADLRKSYFFFKKNSFCQSLQGGDGLRDQSGVIAICRLGYLQIKGCYVDTVSDLYLSIWIWREDVRPENNWPCGCGTACWVVSIISNLEGGCFN